MRQGGLGVPAFYTPTGVGTYVEYGKVPVRFIAGSPIPDMVSKPKEVILKCSLIQEKGINVYYFLKITKNREESSMVSLTSWKKPFRVISPL